MTNYLSIEEVVEIHKILINEFGGSDGLRDFGSLESAVTRPQTGYYNNLIEEASALMESLAINHPFVDGNKRIAFFATDTFLRMNGFYIDCDSEKAYSFFMNLFEKNTFKFQFLLEWLKLNTKKVSN